MTSGKILDFNAALSERELTDYLAKDHDPARRDKVLAGLNESVEAFVAHLFPSAIITPRVAMVGDIHGSPGTSLKIETKGSKRGLWCDFANPDVDRGNLIDLYMAARQIPFVKAIDELAEWVGHGTRPEIRYARAQTVKKLKRFDRELGPTKGEWHYTDADGKIIASVYRYEPQDEDGQPLGKEFLPWDAVRHQYGNPDVRPLYNLPGVLKASEIVFTEGEKAAEALINRGITATCVMGGCNSPLDRSDLEPLKGKRVTIWPDNDEPGRKFAANLAAFLHDSQVTIIEPPADMPDGWDAADTDEPEAYLGHAVTPNRAQPTLPYFWFGDAEPSLEANDFVENLLTSGAMSVIYGPSNCGKTFFVLDLALHVAWGQEWRGKEVDKGAIVYLSLEGSQGVRNRIAAFRKHHEIESLPFVVMPKPVDLLDSQADVAAVIQLTQFVAAHTGLPVRMVIVDTLSRAMAGGNENSPEDMTALIGNCDRIRDATGAHVSIVHHSGKDEARGARGHSSLRAATDTEIEIRRDPELTRSTVRVAKQRDLEADDPFAFTLKSVDLGTNRRGKPVTSCVVLEANETVLLARDGTSLSPKETEALSVLTELLEEPQIDPETGEIGVVPVCICSDEWRMALGTSGTISRDNQDTARRQFNRLRKSLQSKGIIQTKDNLVRLAGQSGT